MQPLAADLNGVVTMNDRKTVLHVSTPQQFVNRWIQKERVTKSKRRPEPHRSVSRHVRRSGITRAQLARIRKMRLVHLVCSDGAEEIYVEVVDLGRTLNAIG